MLPKGFFYKAKNYFEWGFVKRPEAILGLCKKDSATFGRQIRPPAFLHNPMLFTQSYTFFQKKHSLAAQAAKECFGFPL